MTTQDMPAFSARLTELAELYDSPLTESKILFYFEALRDLDFDVVCRAVLSAVQTSKFMPRPAELRSLAVGDSEDQAEAAWMMFKKAAASVGAYSSLSTTDAALGDTIVAVFGSWPAACHADLSPEMWSAKRKEFGRVYRVLSARGVTGQRYLGGIVDQNNAHVAEWQQYTPVALVEGTDIKRLQNRAALGEYTPAEGEAATGLQRLKGVIDATVMPNDEPAPDQPSLRQRLSHFESAVKVMK
jgi:hypothetical protein